MSSCDAFYGVVAVASDAAAAAAFWLLWQI